MIHELMNGCVWAENRSKLERAIKEIRGDNNETGELGTREVTEEAVKKVYIRLLGKVLDVKEDGQTALKDKPVNELRAIAEDRGIEHAGLTKKELLKVLK